MANKRFIILGAGGHGKVVADLVRACGADIVGFVDLDEARVGEMAEPGGAEVVLSQEAFFDSLESTNDLPGGADAVVVAIGNNDVRARLVARVGERRSPALVHPSATVSPSVTIGAGTVVFPHAVINADADIGDAVIVNTGAVVEHDCTLQNGTHVSPNATLSGKVSVGECSWLGSGSVVIPGIEIGADVVVGAGAVVIRDVPANSTVVGNPAARVE